MRYHDSLVYVHLQLQQLGLLRQQLRLDPVILLLDLQPHFGIRVAIVGIRGILYGQSIGIIAVLGLQIVEYQQLTASIDHIQRGGMERGTLHNQFEMMQSLHTRTAILVVALHSNRVTREPGSIDKYLEIKKL